MKTRLSILFKSLIALTLVIAMSACNPKNPSPEEVANAINTGAQLSEPDYSTMIDYCGDYAKQAQKFYDLINQQPNDSTAEAIKATNDLADLYASYPYLELFRNTLSNVELSVLGADNEKKVNEYASYQGFPLPVGEDAKLEDPDVVGMIEQTPTSDTTGVISQGAGEAVDTNVK